MQPTVVNFPSSLKRFLLQPLVRLSTFVMFLLLSVFIPAFMLAPVPPAWAPEPLVLWAFDMRLLIGRPIITLGSLARAVEGDTTVTFHRDGEQVAFTSDGLIIVGTLYGAGDLDNNKPAILLLHGSTPQGRQLGLYRLMSHKLAERGYIVLTIDQRGFGQSDDPPNVHDVSSFDFVADVDTALTYLAVVPGVNREAIYLIGHSFGGDVAITAVADGGVAAEKLVLFGPARRSIERGGMQDSPEFDYFRRREMRFMALCCTIPADVFQSYRTALPLENHLDYLSQPDHVPLLLLDGALENSDDLLFLQEVFVEAAGEKVYATLENADHYANVANFGPLIIYDRTTMAELISIITAFLATVPE